MPYKLNPFTGAMDYVAPPPTADDVVETSGKVFVTPSQRDQIGQQVGIGWIQAVANYAALPAASSVTNGHVYLVQASSGVWPFRKLAGFYQTNGSSWTYMGDLTLGGLADVDVSTVSDGQILKYDSANGGWKNADPPSGGSSGISLASGYVNVSGTTALDGTAYSKAHKLTATGAYTVTLPTPVVGGSIMFKVDPAATGLITLDAGSGKTIDGAQQRQIWAGESVTLTADSSTNWIPTQRVAIPMYCKVGTSGTSLFAASTKTLVIFNLFKESNVPTGMNMFDSANCRMFALRPGKLDIRAMVTSNGTNTTSAESVIYCRRNGAALTSNDQIARFKPPASSTVAGMGLTSKVCVVGDYIDIFFEYLGGSYTTSVYGAGSEFVIQEAAPW